MSRSPFLGQDLMRQAIDEQSLHGFEEPAGVMHDANRPLTERNDAFTAIRFGLAGLVLRAWEPTIVESCEPYNFGGNTIDCRFKDDEFFGPPDLTIDTADYDPRHEPCTVKTQGEYALEMVGHDLQSSMGKVLASPEEYAVATISVGRMLGAIRTYVTQAKALGLTSVPDIFDSGRAITEDFYRVDQSEQIDIDGLRVVARNPVRFTSPAIRYLMHTSTESRWLQAPDGSYTFDTQLAERYNPEQHEDMLFDILMHAARASQRASTLTVVSEETIVRKFSFRHNQVGKPEVFWARKHMLPIRRLEEGESLPDRGVVSNRQRNKCPIGYTEHANDQMPIRRIYHSILSHLVNAGLHRPDEFVKPKVIGTSLRGVR